MMTRYVRKTAALLIAAMVAILTTLGTASTSWATEASPPPDSGYYNADTCSGWNGVGSNFGSGLLGTTAGPILFRPQLGEPFVDGNVIRATGTISFKSIGSCMAQVAFQLQTKACGTWGCSWETRNHGTWEYLWEHAADGSVTGQVAMSCRPGTHSYRLHMAVVGPATISEEPRANGRGAAISVDPVASAGQAQDGRVVKLNC